MLEDGKRATEIIKRIRLLFEKGPTLREPVDLNEVIREMIALLRSEAKQNSIAVRAVLDGDLPGDWRSFAYCNKAMNLHAEWDDVDEGRGADPRARD